MSNSQPAPISGNVINQILYLEIPENNSRQVDKCCTAGLGTSKIWSLCCCTIVPCGISDHFPYFLCLDISPYTNKNPQYVKVKTRGPDTINNLISEIRNSDMTSKLTLNYTNAMGKSMQTKLVKFDKKKHKKSKWITQGLLNSITYRDKMYNKLKDTPNNSTAYLNLRLNVRTYNKILNTSINKAKSSYYHRCFENAKNDMKRQWSTINEILHKQTKKTKFPDHFVIDGKQITDQKAISNAFNNYFVNIGPDLAAKIKLPSSKSFKNF